MNKKKKIAITIGVILGILVALFAIIYFWKIVAWLLAILIFVIIIMLFTPVIFDVSYENKKIKIYLRYFFAKIKLFVSDSSTLQEKQVPDTPPLKHAQSTTDTQLPQQTMGGMPKPNPVKYKQAPNPPDFVKEQEQKQETKKEKFLFSADLIKPVISITIYAFQEIVKTAIRFAKTLKIYDVKIALLITGEDASDTAIQYGKTSAYIYSIYALLQNYKKIGRQAKIEIQPNFISQEKSTAFSFKVQLLLFDCLWLGIVLSTKILVKLVALFLEKKKKDKQEKQQQDNSKTSETVTP